MHHQEQKLQNMHQDSISYHFRKKLIQLGISFSLLSIIFWHPSWQPFFHSFISQISTFSSHLFSFATDKNYIFLLCNGILVFIAKYSSHSEEKCQSHQSETNPNSELFSKAYNYSMQSPLIEKPDTVENVSNDENEYGSESQANAVGTEDEVEDKYVVYQITDGTVIDKEVASEAAAEEEDDDADDDDNEGFIEEVIDGRSYEGQVEEEIEGDKGEFNGWPNEVQVEEENEDDKGAEEEEEVVEEYEEEEEDEAIAKMSTEELNRKFDDFIRRMKEELRIEAQRQLIVV